MAWEDTAKWSAKADEGYWRALLADESFAAEVPPELEDEEMVVSSSEAPPVTTVKEGLQSSDPGNDPDALDRYWQCACEALDSGEHLQLLVTEFNRGGLLVRLGALSGFVPCSQLAGLPRSMSSQLRIQVLQERVGETLGLRVIEIDRDRGRLILSERAALESAGPRELLDHLSPGDVRTGRVIQVRPFGAFVDLGGLEGLIHISELSWGWVSHPADMLRPGDEVQVYVIGVNRAEHKVALSLKRLTPDPWTLVDDRYSVGDLVEGMVTNVVSFGAFMQLEEGLEGLIHISELANGNFMHPRMVVREGGRVSARVLDIDSSKRRLALSLRQVHNAERQGSEAE